MMNATATQSDWFRVRNLDEIATPALLINPAIIESNLDLMIKSVGGDPNQLRPHVKTHKMRRVVEMKLARGIRKFKTSTIAESEMCLDAGARDVLLAMQPVGPDIERLCLLAQRFPEAKVAALVDDFEVIKCIQEVAKALDQHVPVYIDLNIGMNRTGIRPNDEAFGLVKEIVELSHVSLAGLHAYDGHLIGKDIDQLSEQNSAAFASVWKLKQELEQSGIPIDNVVGGGTPTSPILASSDHQIEVSAGTTVLWDAGQGSRMPDCDFQPAVVIATRVRSRPKANQVCLDLGHKAVAAEMPLPRCHLIDLPDADHISQSEEHLVVQASGVDRLSVGDCLFAIPIHICPTMALHQGAWCISDQTAKDFWTVDARDRKLTV